MQLTVVTPTFNEAPNIERFVRTVSETLRGVEHEIVIADDDSPDQTWRIAQELRPAYPSLRVLRRRRPRSLAGSVVDGFAIASGDAIACIDADLQHDASVLPVMFAELRAGADLVVGSRYMPGGGTTNWRWIRRVQSRLATRLAQTYLGLTLHDPMSGYFMLRRTDFLAIHHQLSAQGFKILIEIAACLRPRCIVEVPYVFGPRLAGRSKLTATVAWHYLAQLRRLRSTTAPARARAAHSAT